MDYSKQLDYSSLDTYLTCPRKFMFRYIMHLTPTGPPSLDLVFGSCWHYGMECAFTLLSVNPDLSADTLTEEAIKGFNQLWLVEAAPYFDPDSCFPKNPGRAHDMFYAFFSTHLPHFREATILGVESPFTIHLRDDMPIYTGRLDLVIHHPTEGLEIVDWKTAKWANDTTFNGFEMSLQKDGYLTAGHLYYDKLPLITYWVALCQKTKIEHYAHTIRRGKKAIDRFLDDLVAHANAIGRDQYVYNDCLEKQHQGKFTKADNPPCFRRKPGYACTLYFRKCEFFDICQIRNNPLEWALEPPQGYEYKEWDPSQSDAKVKLGGSKKTGIPKGQGTIDK